MPPDLPDEVWLRFRGAVEAMLDAGQTAEDIAKDVAEIAADWSLDAS